MPSASCSKASARAAARRRTLDLAARRPRRGRAMRWPWSRPRSSPASMPLVGGRELPEIAARLANKAADRRETPLAPRKGGCAQRLSRHRGRGLSASTRPSRRSRAARASRAPGNIMRSACSRWRSWASTRAASISRRASGASSNTTRASPSRSRRTRRMGPSPWRAAGAMTISSPTWAAPVAVPAVGCAIHTDRLKAVLA